MTNHNPEDRYRVIYPGSSHGKGYQVDEFKYIQEARECRNKSSHPLTYIWDDKEGRGIK